MISLYNALWEDVEQVNRTAATVLNDPLGVFAVVGEVAAAMQVD